MKNTKSRKKILLSSIAMLLVALVALGSATYAWFTMNKTVEANTMQVKVVAPAGIQISNTKESGSWSDWQDNSVSYDSDKTIVLNPVSWNGSAATSYVPAGDVNTGGKETGLTYKAVDREYTSVTKVDGATKEMYSNANYAVYDLAIKSKADKNGTVATRTGVTAKVSFDSNTKNAEKFIRCALIDVTGSSATKDVYAAAATAGTEIKNEYITDANGTAADLTSKTFGSTSAALQDITGTEREYKLVVWFEGYDTECVNANNEATGNLKVQFSFTN